MAIIFALLGGVFGMVSAIVSLIVWDASLMTALTVWSTTGLALLATGIAFSMLPRARPQPTGEPEIA